MCTVLIYELLNHADFLVLESMLNDNAFFNFCVSKYSYLHLSHFVVFLEALIRAGKHVVLKVLKCCSKVLSRGVSVVDSMNHPSLTTMWQWLVQVLSWVCLVRVGIDPNHAQKATGVSIVLSQLNL